MNWKILLSLFFYPTFFVQAGEFWEDFENSFLAGRSKTLVDHVRHLSQFQKGDSSECLNFKKDALLYFLSTGGKEGFAQRVATLEEEFVLKRALVFATLIHKNNRPSDVLSLIDLRRSFSFVHESEVDQNHLVESQKIISATHIFLCINKQGKGLNCEHTMGLLQVRFRKSFSRSEWRTRIERFGKISKKDSAAQIKNILAPHLSIIPDAPIPDIHLHLSKELLPEDSMIRRSLLDAYFVDQLPTATVQSGGWEVLLERPASPYGCYQLDPEIREGLTWWERGTRIRDISFAHRFLKGGLLAIEDQWMPLSWSRCFQRLGSVPKELILLHLDDHKDMMSPRIGKRLDGELVDYITGKHVSFMKPETIEEAILSGSIGKGSILTPLIHKVDKIHVRHLSFRPEDGETFELTASLCGDGLLSPLPNRLEVHLEKRPWEGLNSSSSYIITPDEEIWLRNLPDDLPILFHIDMDFFNDRFDGNDSWETEHKRSHNPDVEKQKAMADKVFREIEKRHLEKRIIDISIGISPSFYPAEYWSTMVPYIMKKCRKLGIINQRLY